MSKIFQVPWHWWQSPPRPYEIVGRYREIYVDGGETNGFSYPLGANQLLLLKRLQISFSGNPALNIFVESGEHILWQIADPTGGGGEHDVSLFYVMEPLLVAEGPATINFKVQNPSESEAYLIMTDTAWIINDLNRHRERAPWL